MTKRYMRATCPFCMKRERVSDRGVFIAHLVKGRKKRSCPGSYAQVEIGDLIDKKEIAFIKASLPPVWDPEEWWKAYKLEHGGSYDFTRGLM